MRIFLRITNLSVNIIIIPTNFVLAEYIQNKVIMKHTAYCIEMCKKAEVLLHPENNKM